MASLIAAGLGLGLYFTRPVVNQAEALLPDEGILAYWSPPCGVRLMTQEIATEVEKIKEGKFLLRYTDVYRDRDALAELIDGQVSLVLHEKAFLPEHIQRAAEKGVTLKSVRYALDGIAYIVNQKVDDVEYLTLEQLEKIYRGEITNWKEVGGEDRTITPILLSGLGRNSLFLNFKEKLNPNILYVEDRKEAIEVLRGHDGAFFYTSATLAPLERGVNIISLKNQNGDIIPPVVGGKPNKDAIKNGEYPQIRGLYAIYRSEENGLDQEMVSAFTNFLVSSRGQRIVADAGFVPLYKTAEKSRD